MADLEDVAADFRARRGERMRVATKYVNLTRRFFAEHGVADYRIVESLGATEGAPAAGAAELIVDITTTGATLAANALKTLDDGVILRSQAKLVASLRRALDAERAGRRARDPDAHRRHRGGAPDARNPRAAADPAHLVVEEACAAFDAVPAFGEDADPQGFVALHCARAKAAELADWLLAQGAERVSVTALEQVFDAATRSTRRSRRGSGNRRRAGVGRGLRRLGLASILPTFQLLVSPLARDALDDAGSNQGNQERAIYFDARRGADARLFRRDARGPRARRRALYAADLPLWPPAAIRALAGLAYAEAAPPRRAFRRR